MYQTIVNKWRVIALANVVLLLVIAGTVYWGADRIVSGNEQLLKNEMKGSQLAAAVRAHALEIRRYEKDICLECLDRKKGEEAVAQFHQARSSLLNHLSELQSVNLSLQEKEQVEIIAAELAKYSHGIAGVLKRLKAGEITTSEEANSAVSMFSRPFNQMERAAEKMVHDSTERLGQAKVEMARRETVVEQTFLVVVIVVMVLMIVLSAWLGRNADNDVP